MNFRKKFNYIKEMAAAMMDMEPITCVGQEHPAKKEKKKEHIQETSKVTDYDAYKGRKDAVTFAGRKLEMMKNELDDKYHVDSPSTLGKLISDRTKLEIMHRKQDYDDKAKKLNRNVELFKKKYGHHPERTEEKVFGKLYDTPYIDDKHDDPKRAKAKLEKAFRAKAHVDELHSRLKRVKKGTQCKDHQKEDVHS